MMKQQLVSLVRDEEGQDLIEYALIAGLIALATVAAVTAMGGGLNTLYTTIQNTLASISVG